MINLGVVCVNIGESDKLTLMTYTIELRTELNYREIAYRGRGNKKYQEHGQLLCVATNIIAITMRTNRIPIPGIIKVIDFINFMKCLS